VQSPPRPSQAVKSPVVRQGAAEAIDLLPRELSDAGAPRSRRAVLTTPTVLPDGYIGGNKEPVTALFRKSPYDPL